MSNFIVDIIEHVFPKSKQGMDSMKMIFKQWCFWSFSVLVGSVFHYNRPEDRHQRAIPSSPPFRITDGIRVVNETGSWECSPNMSPVVITWFQIKRREFKGGLRP